jgi:hypothetical protein
VRCWFFDPLLLSLLKCPLITRGQTIDTRNLRRHSQSGQDRTVALLTANKTGGFFVDLAANDVRRFISSLRPLIVLFAVCSSLLAGPLLTRSRWIETRPQPILMSNTRALERDYGWKGVCIDGNRLMLDRRVATPHGLCVHTGRCVGIECCEPLTQRLCHVVMHAVCALDAPPQARGAAPVHGGQGHRLTHERRERPVHQPGVSLDLGDGDGRHPLRPHG